MVYEHRHTHNWNRERLKKGHGLGTHHNLFLLAQLHPTDRLATSEAQPVLYFVEISL
jgi:hypothetical protein